jgi:FAD dependent oxidoreductase
MRRLSNRAIELQNRARDDDRPSRHSLKTNDNRPVVPRAIGSTYASPPSAAPWESIAQIRHQVLFVIYSNLVRYICDRGSVVGLGLDGVGKRRQWSRSIASSSGRRCWPRGRSSFGAGRTVIVVESQDCIGSGISSRNSEVIHAGIYYPSGLDKTRWCISGKAMLYDFCREYHVPHRQCGKLLVAVSETEIDKLSAIKAQAEANGVVACSFIQQYSRALGGLIWSQGATTVDTLPELFA